MNKDTIFVIVGFVATVALFAATIYFQTGAFD